MKLLHLSAAITAATISLIPSLYVRALATEPNYLCFFKTNSGKVVDLSDSVCHGKKSTDGAKNDKAFIEAYKSQAMKYSDVRDNLISSIQSSPEEKIQQAKGVCTDLKAGLSMDEIEEDQEVAKRIQNLLDEGKEVLVTVLAAMSIEKIVEAKEA